MASAPGLPHDKAAWLAAQAKAAAGEKGKELDHTSASKIELKQFLQLRVLWKVQEGRELVKFSHGVPLTILKEAQEQLRGLESWQEYLSCLETSQPLDGPLSQKLGVFALVLEHQNEVKRVLKVENESHVYEFRKRQEVRYWPEFELTPSRPGRKVFDRQADEDPFTPMAAVAKSLGDRQFLNGPLVLSTFIKSLWQHGEKADIDPFTPMAAVAKSLGALDLDLSPQTPLAEARALDIQMFPKAADEQIVNTALIDFLIAITIHFQCPAKWSLHRKSFRIDGFEARVDGYLEYRGTAGAAQIKAIVEVKAAIRNFDTQISRVRMQEGAQMAAWIFSDESEEGCVIHKASRRRRVLISQDRHQIFITLAEYGTEYLNYLRQPALEDQRENESSKSRGKVDKDTSKKGSRTTGAAGLSSDPAPGNKEFLMMNEFGPFNTENPEHMGLLGVFMLALASQMCK